VSTLRQYLEALGAHLELVAVFDDDDRLMPSSAAASVWVRPYPGSLVTSTPKWSSAKVAVLMASSPARGGVLDDRTGGHRPRGRSRISCWNMGTSGLTVT